MKSPQLDFHGHFIEKTVMTIFLGILPIFGQFIFLSLGNPRARAIEYLIFGLKHCHRYHLHSKKGFTTTKTSKLDIFDLKDAPLDFVTKIPALLKKKHFFLVPKNQFCYIEKLLINIQNSFYEADFVFRPSKKCVVFLTGFLSQKWPKSGHFSMDLLQDF